jgi:hypothetical protein
VLGAKNEPISGKPEVEGVTRNRVYLKVENFTKRRVHMKLEIHYLSIF